MPALDAFLDLLRDRRVGPHVFRPWADYAYGLDAFPDAPRVREGNLRAYLKLRLTCSKWLLIAEAPGYQGARFSGIAMTCERTLLGHKPWISHDLVFPGAKTRTSASDAGTSKAVRDRGFCEPTATSVWKALLDFDVAPSQVVLWNTFPFHPHRKGQPLTNRTPSDDEVRAQDDVLSAFLELFPGRQVIAVGDVARKHLTRHGIAPACVRHPSNGGVPEFRNGLRTIVRGRRPRI